MMRRVFSLYWTKCLVGYSYARAVEPFWFRCLVVRN
jgi:hypothetical protein